MNGRNHCRLICCSTFVLNVFQGCGVAQTVVRRLAVRQARVRIPSRHPYGDPSTERQQWRFQSGSQRLRFMLNRVCLNWIINQSKRVAYRHQTFKCILLHMFRRRRELEGGVRAAQVGGAGDAAGPPGFRAGNQPRHPGEDFYQCCGSGSCIRCLFDPRIRDEQPGLYFRELKNLFFC